MRSGGPGFCAFDEVALWKNSVLVRDASCELGAEIRLRNGGAVWDASGGLEPLWKNDVPWVCVLGGICLMMHSVYGLVASVE